MFFASKQIEQFEKDPKRLDMTPPAEPPPVPGMDMAAMGSVDLTKLQQWWVDHMLTTSTPFAERMKGFCVLSPLWCPPVKKRLPAWPGTDWISALK